MNQIQSLQTDGLKFIIMSYLNSLGLRRSNGAYAKISNTNLLGLSSQLNHWNIERVSRKSVNEQSSDLSIEDVNLLKKMIHAAINIASVKSPEVISDQLLFLVIGAIQVQSQTGSDKAWKLVNQSIQSFLSAQKERRAFIFGLTALVTTLFVLCLSALVISNIHSGAKTNPVNNKLLDSPIASIEGTADPVTMSSLLLTYNKMKSGTCQLPQAAMLPPEQRQAFLMFVNKGVIEVPHVEDLRLALGYVNCLYPQELMHPRSSAGNRI